MFSRFYGKSSFKTRAIDMEHNNASELSGITYELIRSFLTDYAARGIL
jgi:hypothetical protein